MDINALKRNVDCRQIVERDLGTPKYHTHTYSSFKCPFHREQKGYSLVVYASHWRCYGKCGVGGDVIGWLIRYHELSFREACERLADSDLPQLVQKSPSMDHRSEPYAEPPDERWQKVARLIAEQATDCLWTSAGRRALDYLKLKRGLGEGIIAAAQLGYIPGKPTEWQKIDHLNVPCGITIPWYADDALWGIKVRRSAGEQRYQQVSGGNLRGCLYLADQIQPSLPLMLTEGEFDALTAWQLGQDKISIASIGSASHGHINLRWYRKLLSAPGLFICTDFDEAGEKAAAEIATLTQAAKRLQVPIGKDLNEFYLRAGYQLTCEWLKRIAE